MKNDPNERSKGGKLIFWSTIITFALGWLIILSSAAFAEPKIWAGMDDYAPNKVVTIFGINFGPNMPIKIKITRPYKVGFPQVVVGDGSFAPGSDTVISDPNGNINYQYVLNGVLGLYNVEAIYSSEGTDIVLASNTFTDDSGDIKTTDAIGGEKEHFKAGDAVWLVGKELDANQTFNYKVTHEDDSENQIVDKEGTVDTDSSGFILPDPTMIWDIPTDYLVPSGKGKGKYKARLYKDGESKAFKKESFSLQGIGEDLPDHGDAPDVWGAGGYPSNHLQNGAWHLDIAEEWLGSCVDGEHETIQPDADLCDDGVVFVDPVTPGSPGNIDVIVNTSGLAGRYVSGSPSTLLFLNGWADWNGDGDWDDPDEKIIGNGSAIGQTMINPNTFGGNSKTFTYSITPPVSIASTFYTRFRLDRGQDGGFLFVGDGLEQTRGKAYSGEVEDYLVEITSQLKIVTTALPNGIVNSTYNQTISAIDGIPPYTWSISGSLPAGLFINGSTGEIFGTPTVSGTFSFDVQVDDNFPDTVIQTFSLQIDPAALTITSTNSYNGTFGTSVFETLSASGGVPSYTWSISVGSLPDGLFLNGSTGEIFGTPTAVGPFSFTLVVTDGNATIASLPCTYTIDPTTVTLSYSSDLGYSDGDGVEPNSGDTLNQFVFKVVYTNSGNLAPILIGVFIDGGINSAMHTMEPATGCGVLCDGSYSNGELYLLSKRLDPGTYSYFFNANDGGGDTGRLPLAGDLPFISTSTNHSLTLEYSVEAGYDGVDGLNPETGDNTTLFTYKVVFTDPDNFVPSIIKVHIDGDPVGTDMLPDTTGAANLHDSNYTNGEQYYFTTTLNPGSHIYYFSATDNDGTIIDLPAANTLTGPVVSGVANDTQDGIDVTPDNNTTVTIYNYDPAGCPTSTVQVDVINNASGTVLPVGYLVGANSYYDITTDTCLTWTTLDIRLEYVDSQFVEDEATLKLWHNPNDDGNWINVTVSHDIEHNIIRGTVGHLSEFVLATEDPTVITLNSFSATEIDGQVLLEWKTVSEIDNVGFNIWRSDKEEGEYVKLNDSLISAMGNSTSGTSYDFTDSTALEGKNFYRLEDIDNNGVSTFHSEKIVLGKSVTADYSGSDNAEAESESGSGCFIGTAAFGF